MRIDEALDLIAAELSDSHTRCHIPYLLTASTCSVGSPPSVKTGVTVQVNSEVFGRIAAASESTFQNALVTLAIELSNSRDTRNRIETDNTP